MYRRQHNLVSLFLPLALVAFGFFASEAAAQKARRLSSMARPPLA